MKMIGEFEKENSILLNEVCPKRKKKVYNIFAVKELRDKQKEQRFGPRVTKNIVRMPLPEVGALIKMQEVLCFIRAHEWEEPSQQGYVLVPYPSTSHSSFSSSGISSNDSKKIYEVIEYIGDTSNPFGNAKMEFRCVYPVLKFSNVGTVPIRLISCGHIRYEVIDGIEFPEICSARVETEEH